MKAFPLSLIMYILFQTSGGHSLVSECHTQDLDVILVVGSLKRPREVTVAQQLAAFFIDSRRDNSTVLRISLLNSCTWQSLIEPTQFTSVEALRKTFSQKQVTKAELIPCVSYSGPHAVLTLKKLLALRKSIVIWFVSCAFAYLQDDFNTCDFDMKFERDSFEKELRNGNVLLVFLGDDSQMRNYFSSQFFSMKTVFLDQALDITTTNLLSLKICGECLNGWSLFHSKINPFITSCFLMDNQTRLMSRDEANDACNGSSLVNIESLEELQYLKWLVDENKLISTNYTVRNVYVGLAFFKTRNCKRWQWSNKHPFIMGLDFHKVISSITNEDACWTLSLTKENPYGNSNNLSTLRLESINCSTRMEVISLCEADLLMSSAQYKNMYVTYLSTPENISKPEQTFLFNCTGFDEYFHFNQVCDGEINCKSGLDEEYCPIEYNETKEETKNTFACCKARRHYFDDVNDMLPAETFCDVDTDYINSEDELECNDCFQDKCDDGTCLPSLNNVNEDKPCLACYSYDTDDSTNTRQPQYTCYTFSLPYDVTFCDTNLDIQVINLYFNQTVNTKGHLIHISWSPTCIYTRGRMGLPLGCPNLSHLTNCEDFRCPENMVKCPFSYCIPVHYIQDNVMDCMYGEDEEVAIAVENKQLENCIIENHRVHPTYVCNWNIECNNLADEVSCHDFCPPDWTCQAGVVIANSNTSVPTFSISHKLRVLRLSGTNFSSWPYINFKHVLEVYVDRCNIFSDAIFKSSLKDVNNRLLYQADLSYNQLKTITSKGFFSYFTNLQFIRLDFNLDLETIDIGSIVSKRIRLLNLSFTSISTLPETLFESLYLENLILYNTKIISLSWLPKSTTMALLDLRKTIIDDDQIIPLLYKNLTIKKALYSDNAKMCCPSIAGPGIPQMFCHSPVSMLSPCDNLLGDAIKRVMLWVVCLVSLTGNIATLVHQYWHTKSSDPWSLTFLFQNLNVGDLIMGFYVLIIVSADMHYNQVFIAYEKLWRNSPFCQAANFKSTLALETSVFFLLLIFYYLKKYLKNIMIDSEQDNRKVSVTAIILWVLSLALAIPPAYISNLSIHTFNNMCLGLPMVDTLATAWIYSVTVIIGLNMLMLLFTAYLLLASLKYLWCNKISSNRKDSQKLKNMFLSLSCRYIFLLLLCLLGLMYVVNQSVSLERYSWLASILTPLSSATSPIIYITPLLHAQWIKYKTGRLNKTAKK